MEAKCRALRQPGGGESKYSFTAKFYRRRNAQPIYFC
jgi:hypothetical protein